MVRCCCFWKLPRLLSLPWSISCGCGLPGLFFPNLSEGGAIKRYMTSFSGVIDLLSFLPYYLPVFFPAGATVFWMFRVIRIFRLFQINAYYDSLNVIAEVISSKRQQLFSSVFTILLLMLVPKGELMLLEGDKVILYCQERIANANKIQI